MIMMYTARTSETDEVGDAVIEITSQIDLAALKKNSRFNFLPYGFC